MCIRDRFYSNFIDACNRLFVWSTNYRACECIHWVVRRVGCILLRVLALGDFYYILLRTLSFCNKGWNMVSLNEVKFVLSLQFQIIGTSSLFFVPLAYIKVEFLSSQCPSIGTSWPYCLVPCVQNVFDGSQGQAEILYQGMSGVLWLMGK